MHEYEIRILNKDGSPSLTMWLVHLNAKAAITAARKAAKGSAFEVWRDDECLYGVLDDQSLPFPKRRSA